MSEEDVLRLMVEKLKEMPEESRISAKSLLSHVTPNAESFDLARIFRLLVQEAEKQNLILETPIHNRYEVEDYYKHLFTVYRRRPGKPCPRCSSRFTANVLFCATTPGPEEQAQIDAKEMVWGGCCQSQNPESFYCLHCHKSFGRHHSADCIHSLSVERDMEKVTFTVTGKGTVVTENGKTVATLTQADWLSLAQKMIDRCYLMDWRPTYINKVSPVGNLWRVGMEVAGEKPRKYRGWNAFPPYWDIFVNLIDEILKKRS